MQSESGQVSTESSGRLDACPATVDELREILTSNDGSVQVQGGGTRLRFANLAKPAAQTVSTRKLDKVLHYEPADMTIAVEAGLTLAELNSVLGEHNQIVPLDAFKPEVATLGGLFASGLAGPRRFRYGSLRDLVLGLEVMGPDGVLTKSGGMVVKNVTGFDMPRLHHGAHGAFGIVTRLNLKVLPREQASRSILLSYNSVQDAFGAATAILRSQQEPTSVTVSSNDGWLVSVVCDGPETTIDAQATAIADIGKATGDPERSETLEGSDPGLKEFQSVVDTDTHPALARLSVPASKQLEVVGTLTRLAGSTVCADPGSGLIYVAGIASMEWRETIRQVAPESVFLSLPDELKAHIDVFGPVDTHTLRLLQRIKEEFDPQRRLNRDRYIAGI